MNPSQLIVLAISLLLILSCKQQAPSLTASSRWHINQNVLVDGKLSAKGNYSALLFSDNTLELWNNEVRKKVAHWHEQKLIPDTERLDLSASAEYILTASDKAVQVWHVEADESLGSLDLSKHLGDAGITQIRFWSPPYTFIVGTSSGQLIFADITNNTYRVNHTHTGEVVKLELTENKDVLFSGGNDGQVIKWDLLNYQPLTTKTLPYRITSLAIAKISYVFISDALKQHILWNSERDKVVGQLEHWQRFKWFREAIFDPKLRWLVTTSPKTDVFIWDLSDMTVSKTWSVEAQSLGSTVEDLVFIAPSILRTLSSDGVLQDWDLKLLVANDPVDG